MCAPVSEHNARVGLPGNAQCGARAHSTTGTMQCEKIVCRCSLHMVCARNARSVSVCVHLFCFCATMQLHRVYKVSTKPNDTSVRKTSFRQPPVNATDCPCGCGGRLNTRKNNTDGNCIVCFLGLCFDICTPICGEDIMHHMPCKPRRTAQWLHGRILKLLLSHM